MKTNTRAEILTAAVVLTCMMASTAMAQQRRGRDRLPTYDTPEAAQEDPDFSIQGEYTAAEESESSKAMQVVALGRGTFRVVIYSGGLPGAGWDGTEPEILEQVSTEAVQKQAEDLGITRIERKSPTLGQSAPEGAVVLFDGTKESLANWESGARITEDGLLMQGVTSKEKFGDYTIHVEFRTPYQPGDRGQQRGNSGIYHQGRYETQVLDSFGLEGLNNETGGIYEVSDPKLNMCLPPLVWQTYDVEVTSAKFNDQGEKTEDARITAKLNGIVVQDNVAVPHVTRAAPVEEGPEPGPIYLQDHGNPVRFRNVWVVPRKAEAE